VSVLEICIEEIMDSLKILVFNWRCWFNQEMGGAEVFTHEVLKRWAEDGHDVTLFTSKYKGCLNEEFADGVKIVRRGGRFSVYWKARDFYARNSSNEYYDVVIDEINTRPFMTPKFVNNGEKVVALIHQLAREYWFYETRFPINYVGYYFLEKRWLKSYRRVLTATVSESTRNDLLACGFEKVFVLGEGLNFKPLEKLSTKEDYPVIVYAGRLKRAKRPDHAVRAFKIVKTVIPNVELWVIGEGYLKNRLMKISCEGVKFFSSLSNEQRRNLIKKAWVLVNPSVREGFGLNILEANALGVPCIAYDVPGLRDSVINNETGVLVSSGNVNALAEATIRILMDAPLRIKLSENALVHSRIFSWDNVADRFLNIITTRDGV
jgi:glycosyltransferase involved in cell wall biosynthesis